MWPAVPSCALVADVESASFLSTTRSPRGPLGMPCRSPAPPFFVAARRCHAVWLRVRRWHADIDRIASYILPARPMSRHRFQRASEVSAPLVELTPRTAEPAVLCCNEHEKQLADCCIAADFLCMLFTYVDLHNLLLGAVRYLFRFFSLDLLSNARQADGGGVGGLIDANAQRFCSPHRVRQPTYLEKTPTTRSQRLRVQPEKKVFPEGLLCALTTASFACSPGGQSKFQSRNPQSVCITTSSLVVF